MFLIVDAWYARTLVLINIGPYIRLIMSKAIAAGVNIAEEHDISCTEMNFCSRRRFITHQVRRVTAVTVTPRGQNGRIKRLLALLRFEGYKFININVFW